jgi:hypothetical protein
LLLLNKSCHIQKYTINKLTNVLEDVYAQFSDPNDTYEITNINKTENLCYILHVLQIILQWYVKNKENIENSQNTHSGSKKLSISDIWRRKWNPNFKENTVDERITPKKCVLLKCNDILNKLIVTCMDGYNLVSFAALQCFNLLQS